jgi:hypothetical protein
VGGDRVAGAAGAVMASFVHTATFFWQALLVAGLFSCMPARAEDQISKDSSELWATKDHSLVLYRGDEANMYRICPIITGMIHQPFCRRFEAPVLGACGLTDDLQLVLANGEIHRVNRALIGVDGGFGPAYRPEHLLNLVKAWIPQEACLPGEGFNHVLAVTASGDLWHFDGADWRRISGHRIGLLGLD